MGVSAFGCNPMNIEYTDGGSDMVVNTAVLDGVAPNFAQWQGPVS